MIDSKILGEENLGDMELIPGDTVQGGRLGVRNGVWSFDEICWGKQRGQGTQMWSPFLLEQDFGRFWPKSFTMQCGKKWSWSGLMSKRIAQSLCLNQIIPFDFITKWNGRSPHKFTCSAWAYWVTGSLDSFVTTIS